MNLRRQIATVCWVSQRVVWRLPPSRFHFHTLSLAAAVTSPRRLGLLQRVFASSQKGSASATPAKKASGGKVAPTESYGSGGRDSKAKNERNVRYALAYMLGVGLLVLWYQARQVDGNQHLSVFPAVLANAALGGPLRREAVMELLAERGAVVNASGMPVTVADLEGKTLGLYSSALWCPPCMRFSPILREFYKACNRKEKTLEIVFVSCDLTADQHKAYVEHAHDQWLHVPYSNQEVLQTLKKGARCWAGPKDKDDLGIVGHQYGIPTLMLFHPTDPIRVKFDGVSLVQGWYQQEVLAARQGLAAAERRGGGDNNSDSLRM